jgi:multiple sugar transport system permease protein
MQTSNQITLNPERAQTRSLRRWRERMWLGTCFVVLLILAVPFVAPFLWMVSTSLKTLDQTMHFPPSLIPSPIRWSNYPSALTEVVPLYLYFWNTVVYTVPATFGAVFSSALVAYGFAKFRAPGRHALFMLVLSTLLIPFPVIMVPQYLLFQKLHWIDTYLPLIVPNFFGSAFLIFMLRQFMLGIPNDLIDAARIDGAGTLGTFWWIVLPLSRLGLVAATVLTFAANWNDYLGPLLFLNSREKFTIQLGLTNFVAHRGSSHWELLMAGSVMATLPVLLIFFVAQRSLIQGIVITGVK